jgi:RNA polymerase sigma-70 factor (ECF subfamily)
MSRDPRRLAAAALPHAEAPASPLAEGGPSPHLDVEAIYAAHFPYVWHSLRRLGIPVKDLPDVTHDVFVTVARALPAYDRTRPLKPWLFGVAYRIAADHLRLHRNARELLGREDEPPGIQLADIGPTPEEALLDSEARALAAACFAALDVRHRAVLIMFDVEGHDARQIALALDIPLKTVYSRLRTARLDFSAAAGRLVHRKGPR